jgi:PBP1b-binding outer membrane lipoprotein LpoB
MQLIIIGSDMKKFYAIAALALVVSGCKVYHQRPLNRTERVVGVEHSVTRTSFDNISNAQAGAANSSAAASQAARNLP